MNTLVEQAAAVRDRSVSPVELVQAALDSIARTMPQTNAWTQVFADDALARAKELEGAGSVGPLHGVPIGIKDLYDVEGAVTSGCCTAYLERVADADSPVVASLRAAGAIVVGKTNMHELAFGPTSQLSCYGPVRNPWDTSLIPGGSSGGSGAAIASRTVLMSMGSDTGGSIRIPAACCGTSGLKPTHGAVSLRGAMPMTGSFDTGGPLAVSVEDCITVHRIIAGFDTDYPYSRFAPQVPTRPVRGLKIGVLRNWISEASDDVQKSVAASIDVFTSLGAELIEMDGLVPTGMRAELGAVLMGEFADHYRDLWDNAVIGDNIRGLLVGGRSFQATDYARGREFALRTHMTFMEAFETYDLLLSPTLPHTAPPATDSDPIRDAISLTLYTMPVNAAGLPAVVFPNNSDGLPTSTQLIGPPWSEEFLAATGAAFQAETQHHLRAAPIT